MTEFFRKSAEGFPVEPEELLAYARNVCESLGLVYLVTGSTATIAYGEPRFTNDIDILVDLPLNSPPRTERVAGTPRVVCGARGRHHQENGLLP
ncbi:MAG: hypothetical protein JNL58_14550 [Planctomyces sp.]|nr:hypothetical protein [Planctomyces sp.]